MHNTFPLLSPAVLYACRAQNTPVAITLHNYRLMCASRNFFRNGTICHDCVTGPAIQAVAHGCYKNSRLATATVVLANTVHRQAWRTMVSAYMFISAAQRDLLAGLDLTQNASSSATTSSPPATSNPAPPAPSPPAPSSTPDDSTKPKASASSWPAGTTTSPPTPTPDSPSPSPAPAPSDPKSPPGPPPAPPSTSPDTPTPPAAPNSWPAPAPSSSPPPGPNPSASSPSKPWPSASPPSPPTTAPSPNSSPPASTAPSSTPGNPQALATAITDIQDNPRRYHTYGEQARDTYTKKFDPDRNIDQLLEIYRFAITNPA